jgi:hypothetical protein
MTTFFPRLYLSMGLNIVSVSEFEFVRISTLALTRSHEGFQTWRSTMAVDDAALKYAFDRMAYSRGNFCQGPGPLSAGISVTTVTVT